MLLQHCQRLRLKKLHAFEFVSVAQWYLEENPRKAVKTAEKAMSFCQEVNSHFESAALGVAVQAHLSIKDSNKAWMLKEAELAVIKAKEGATRFRRLGDFLAEGYALNALVVAQLAGEHFREAAQAAEQACDSFRIAGDVASEAAMLQMLAQLYLKLQHNEKAYATAQSIDALSMNVGDRAMALEAICEYQCRIGTEASLQEALNTAQELQQMCRAGRDAKREAAAVLLASKVYFLQGEVYQALSAAQTAHDSFHDLGCEREEARALQVAAELHALSKNSEAAVRCAKRARNLLRDAGDDVAYAHVQFLCAQMQLLAICSSGALQSHEMHMSPEFFETWSEAAQSASETASLAKRLGDARLAGSALCIGAQIQLARIQVESALKMTAEATDLFGGAKDERSVACAMCIEADVHLMKGSTKKGSNVATKALEIFRKHGDTRGEWAALSILEHIDGPPQVQVMQVEDLAAQEDQVAQYKQWMAAQQQAEAAGPIVVKRERKELDMTKRLDATNLNEAVVASRVQDIVRASIDLDDDDEFGNDTPLMQVGVTSKAAVTLRNALSEELPSIPLPFTLVFDYPTINSMSGLIVGKAV